MTSADIAPERLDAWLDVATAIARDAGALLRERYAEGQTATAGLHVARKGHAHNLVTQADLDSEARILVRLAEAFPTHRFLAEEGGHKGAAPTAAPLWLIDPLDGTNNFAHGIGVFAVNLALTLDEEVLLGVTFDPLRDELFSARRGGGAWLNGRRLTVSANGSLEEAVVATGFPYDKQANPDNNLAQFASIMPLVRGIRRMGSAALDLAYVAAGRFDAYWERGIQAWDVAPGILLVREAGGKVTDDEGRPMRPAAGRITASNGLLHPMLLERLAAARRPQDRSTSVVPA
jgi:myo-inositol-1(or 4)-monophosphatase